MGYDQGRQIDLKKAQAELAKPTFVRERTRKNEQTGEIERYKIYNDKHKKWANAQIRRMMATVAQEQRCATCRRFRDQLIKAAKAHNMAAEVKIQPALYRHRKEVHHDNKAMEKFHNYG